MCEDIAHFEDWLNSTLHRRNETKKKTKKETIVIKNEESKTKKISSEVKRRFVTEVIDVRNIWFAK